MNISSSMASIARQDTDGLQQDSLNGMRAQNAAIMDTSPPNQQLIHDEYPTTQQHLLDHVESLPDDEMLKVDSVVSNAIQEEMQS
jgi:hypothetical protein